MTTPDPLALTNLAGGATDQLLDAILATDRVVASVHAMRATAINQLFENVLHSERLTDAAAGRPLPAPRSADGWNAETRAHRVAASELACAMRISERQATDLIEQSRALATRLPATREALAAGRISLGHAAAMVDEASTMSSVVDERDRMLAEAVDASSDDAGELPSAAEVVAEFERRALRHAETTSPGRFRQRARRLRERLEPMTRERRCAERVAERGVWVEPARDGMAYLTAYLPAADAWAAYNRISDIANQLGRIDRGADSVAGAGSGGDGAGVGGSDGVGSDTGVVRGDGAAGDGVSDDRTLPQRRADVFRDLLFDGVMPAHGTGTGIRPTVLVTVPVMTLLGHDTAEVASVEGHGPISDAEARRLAAAAPSFIRVLTHPETGATLSVGRDRYVVPRDLRMWLRVRDEYCRFPGCGRAASHSDVDHTRDWQHGGTTSADNLAHLCPSHHRLKHHTRWRVQHDGGGTLLWTAPSGRTYRTEPAHALPSG
ncbi:DUF222 domain-containing protein [Microcella sp.]|uniref:HNH endonuclease signature motif containing protein n=1 Tax=Microcella sp. TaxID=1913979 RepID=UPI003919728C